MGPLPEERPTKPRVDEVKPKRKAEVFKAPALAENQEWCVIGYLLGRETRQCPLGFNDFQEVTYLGQSGDYFHFIGDGRHVLVCTIKFKS